jgi:hypothetical protein
MEQRVMVANIEVCRRSMFLQEFLTAATPAKAGVQKFLVVLDSRFHGNDGEEVFQL